IDRWIVRPFRRGFLENLLNGRQWDFGIPPDSWRIRFDPRFVVHEVSLPSWLSVLQIAVTPPSTASVWPVMKAQASEANSAVTPLRSSGPPLRFIGAISEVASVSSCAVIFVGK